MGSDCASGEVCVVDACVIKASCTESEIDCMGDTLMVCTNGAWVTSKCPTGEVCFGKVCAPEVICTGTEKTCQGGKLMTCSDNAWVASDCESDLVCIVGACVEKPPCTEADTECEAGKLLTCTSGKWVASDCAVGDICVADACVKDTPVTSINPEVIACGKLSISGSDTCEKTGLGPKVVLRGDILTHGKTYKGGSVVVDNNKIIYVGCEPDMAGAMVITCPDAVVSAGLINAHEHITYSNNGPANWADERFDHRHDWRKGLNGHKQVNGPKTSVNEVAEFRSLMSGTTGIFGSGSVTGLVRNLDKESIGGAKFPVYQTFPLGDSSGTLADSGCSKYTYSKDNRSDCAYGSHIAEGINMAAYNELVCLSTSGGGAYNVFNNRLAIIQGVAATPSIIAKLALSGGKLIWSARTNVALYGDTAATPLFDRLGVTVGLGTDWIYSGSANMLRELVCVDYLNAHHYNKHFNDHDIWLMATYNNALALGLESVLGELKVGLIADIAVFKGNATKKHHRAVIDAQNTDVALVVLDGKRVFGDANLVTGCETVDVCGSSKGLCLSLSGTTKTYASINVSKKSELFFRGTPLGEPTCVPKRTRYDDTTAQTTTRYDGAYSLVNDRDGDGIANDVDNCPDHFNPVRPQDLDRKQSDVDVDGLGDICDPYPFCVANNETCV